MPPPSGYKVLVQVKNLRKETVHNYALINGCTVQALVRLKHLLSFNSRFFFICMYKEAITLCTQTWHDQVKFVQFLKICDKLVLKNGLIFVYICIYTQVESRSRPGPNQKGFLFLSLNLLLIACPYLVHPEHTLICLFPLIILYILYPLPHPGHQANPLSYSIMLGSQAFHRKCVDVEMQRV